jgi:SAM-dependent methyltransferase
MKKADPALVARLPVPFRSDRFHLLREGVHDCDETAVFINEVGDFAFLAPLPEVDYRQYKTRKEALGLTSYQPGVAAARASLAKFRRPVETAASLLEIGSGDAPFLTAVREVFPGLALASIEVDETTKAFRDRISGLEQYASFDGPIQGARTFDCVVLLHVLEHILDPAAFLGLIRAVTAPGGSVVIEVPSMRDPLLGCLAPDGVPAYRKFFFQLQHPYVYTPESLVRLLEANGFAVREVLPHQRYGLENHLTWLAEGRPGGNPRLAGMFAGCDQAYRADLERSGNADSVIVVAQPA